MVLNGKGSVSL